MDFNKAAQPNSEDSVTLIVKKSTRNIWLAKVIILLGLSFIGGYFFAMQGATNYQTGSELTEQEYLATFEEYRAELLEGESYANVPVATFTMLILVSFLIGSYEFAAVIIGFMVGKVIGR